MKKYFLIARLTWDEILTYRLSFTMWRVRWVLGLVAVYFLWAAVFPTNGMLFGYTQSLMLTYILGSSLISSVVLSSKTIAIGDEINQGNLSNFLIKPINYFKYWFARDLGDKAMNICFATVELSMLFAFLRPPVFIQTNVNYIFLTAISVFIALILFFFINFLLGLIGFWTEEVWAPRFVFFIILNFFAGQLFPLDILPATLFSIFRFLPFTYLLFFPIKIYLGQLSLIEVYFGLIISVFWLVILYLLLKFVWKRGLKNYAAQGR